MNKREALEIKRKGTRLLRPVWRHCFWTWPFGHSYRLRISSGLVCECCGKPFRFSSMTVMQKADVLDEAYDRAIRAGLIEEAD